MSCINCNKTLKVQKNMSRYHRPNQLTHKLQDHKWKPGSFKPDLTILGGLEDISDGEVTMEMLQPHSAHYICHECQVCLRQAVNRKAEVEGHMQGFTTTVNITSEAERRKYYRENYGKDRQGRCWSCFYQFQPEDYKKKRSSRLNFSAPVVEGMDVSEAVCSLFEDKQETLVALLDKKTYICKSCLSLLRTVIKTQCIFDTCLTYFRTKTHPDSVYAKLSRGEDVPHMAQILDEYESLDKESNSADNSDEETVSPVKAVKEQMKTGTKRPFHKTLGNIPYVEQLPGQRVTQKKIKSEKKDSDNDSDDECMEEFSELDNDNSSTNDEDIGETISNEDGTTGEKTEADVVGQSIVTCPEVKVAENQETRLKTEDHEEKRGLTRVPGLESSAKMTDEGSKKKTMQIRVNLLPPKQKTRSGIQEHKTEITRKMADEWVLYYWPGMAGRAEFVRLLFEETGVPYRQSDEGPNLRKLIIEGEMEGYPHFAPPMIQKGTLQVSQTPVICRFLGEQYGLYPDSLEDRLHAEQISQCCHDYIAEGRLAFHGIHNTASYFTQKEETQPYIDRFKAERLPRWLKYFERVLKANKDGKGFLYGDKICYTDLALFHILNATEAQFPDAYQAADYIPLLKAFKERIASRPKIAAYLKSDRWKGFSGNSMM